MGRKTLESLPDGEPLENRVNIVFTRDKNYKKEGTIAVHSVEELLDIINEYKIFSAVDFFIIGGGSIYKQLLPHTKEVLVTRIDGEFEADTYFPDLDKLDDEWYVQDVSLQQESNGHKFRYYTYRRRK